MARGISEVFNFETAMKERKYSFVTEWKVQKDVVFELFKETGGSRRTPEFTSDFYGSVWYLELCNDIYSSDCLKFYLRLTNANIGRHLIWFNYKLIFKNANSSQNSVVDYSNKWYNGLKCQDYSASIRKDTIQGIGFYPDDFIVLSGVCFRPW